MDSGWLAAVIDVLKIRPTMDDVAEFLTLGAFRAFRARSCAVVSVDYRARLALVGSFGLEGAEASRYESLTVWDPHPLATAIREGTPQVTFRAAGLEAREAPSQQRPPCAAMPITAPARVYGAIWITFDVSEAPCGDCLRLLRHVADLMALSWSVVPAPPTAGSGPLSHLSVTSRQAAILQLLDEGLTNSAIARRIGFSESTVRQELMSLFRSLGVHHRGDAVRRAREAGLLDTAPDPEGMSATREADAISA